MQSIAFVCIALPSFNLCNIRCKYIRIVHLKRKIIQNWIGKNSVRRSCNVHIAQIQSIVKKNDELRYIQWWSVSEIKFTICFLFLRDFNLNFNLRYIFVHIDCFYSNLMNHYRYDHFTKKKTKEMLNIDER